MPVIEIPVALGADHGGLALEPQLGAVLRAAGHPVLDFGTDGGASRDHPDFAHPVCRAVAEGRARFGVLVCGTGIGMAVAANRHRGVRAAVLHHATEARLTRAHDGADTACFGGRTTGPEPALDALRTCLLTPFEAGGHARRLAKPMPVAQQEAVS